MELSSDNIEELAKAMSETAGPTRDENGATFNNELKSCNLNVDQAIGDVQDCLLNSAIDPIRSPCSFNDILDDIYEMNKTMELEQATTNTKNAVSPIDDVSGSAPVVFNMPDINFQGEYMPDCLSNQTDFLQPLGQWSDYLSTPASYVFSTIQEIPQFTFLPVTMPTPTITATEPISIPQEEPPSELPTTNVDGNPLELQLVTSTAGAPIQYFNNFHFNFPPPPMGQPEYAVQHCDKSPVNGPVEENAVFMVNEQVPVSPQKCDVAQNQQPSYDWARVVPRKKFVHGSDVIVLRPFRTRKSLSSRQSLDLASYFDTSAIKIPMIRERPRPKNANRRKQKLSAITRADNLKFEIHLLPSERSGKVAVNSDINNNGDQLYPETEIPELDEIFKRKRRSINTRRLNRAHTHSMGEENESGETVELLTPDQPPIESTESDVDSDDAPLTVLKSMKCQKCLKIFKTSRSLTIHSKRCNVMRPILVNEKPPDIPETRSVRKSSLNSNSSKENGEKKSEDGKRTLGPSLGTRPLTRSQTNATKRKGGVVEEDIPKKLSK